MASVDFNAQWLRDMRARLGWSTTETAERAREKARQYGDAIKLSQQLVSKFENGRIKSIPRWLGYVQIAMSHYMAQNELDAGRVWDLRLPREMKEYFEDRQVWLNRQPDDDFDERAELLTKDEELLLYSFRRLPDRSRAMLLEFLDSLINGGSVHSPRLAFRAEES